VLSYNVCLHVCRTSTYEKYSCSHSSTTYTWRDKEKRLVRIPAFQFIQLVQKWIMGKISDPAVFPTDITTSSYDANMGTPVQTSPTTSKAPLSSHAGYSWSGTRSQFPEKFQEEVRNIYRQMMRCYAHIYHGHWVNPFWHLDAYKVLNTCFISYANVGIAHSLITEKDMLPMRPLIDLWRAQGLLKDDTKPKQQIET
jgi:hypothetical protein